MALPHEGTALGDGAIVESVALGTAIDWTKVNYGHHCASVFGDRYDCIYKFITLPSFYKRVELYSKYLGNVHGLVHDKNNKEYQSFIKGFEESANIRPDLLEKGIKLTIDKYNFPSVCEYYNRFDVVKNYHLQLTPQRINTKYYSINYNNENIIGADWSRFALDNGIEFMDLVLCHHAARQVITPYNNYLRFPVYLSGPMSHKGKRIPTLAQLKEFVNKANQKRNLGINQRKLLCTMIARHNNLGGNVGIRRMLYSIYYSMIESPQLYCAGKFMNNTDILKTQYNDDKQKLLEDCLINMCPENTGMPGYVTEKLGQAIEAGCIPVYGGCLDTEKDVFNQEAIIYYDPKNLDGFKQQFREVVFDLEKRNQFIERKPFLDSAAQAIYIRYIFPLVYLLHRDLELSTQALRGASDFDYSYEQYYQDFLTAKQEYAQMGLAPITDNQFIFEEDSAGPFLELEKRQLLNYLEQSKGHVDYQRTFQVLFNKLNANKVPVHKF